MPRSKPALEKAQGMVTSEAPTREFQTLKMIIKEPCFESLLKPIYE